MKLNKNQLGGLAVKILLGGLLVILVGSFVLADIAHTAGSSQSAKMSHRGIELTDARETRDAAQLAAILALNEGALIQPEQFVQEARAFAADRAEKRQNDSQTMQFFIGVVERLHAADKLGIPKPDRAQLQKFITSYRLFSNESGAFDPAQLKYFTETARERLGMNNVAIDNALANAWRIQKLATIAAPAKPPALDVLARRISEKARTEWKIERAVLNRAGYKAAVAADAKADEALYQAAPENYRTPELSRIRVVKLDGDLKTADSLPAPTESNLIELASRRRDKFPLAAYSEPAKFIADNRADLMKTWREEKAGEAAADKLSRALLEHVPPGEARPDDTRVDAMLKTAGLTAKPITPYGKDKLPVGTDIPDALLLEALSLNANNWRTGAIPIGADAYAVIFDGKIPSRLPEFGEVKSRVAADRVAAETDKLFAKAAENKAADVAKAVKAGKKFADAAKAAGLTPTAASTFEYQNAPVEIQEQILALESVPVGGVSGAMRQGADRAIFFIVERKAPAAVKEDPLADRIAEVIGGESARAATTTIGTDR